MGHSNLTEGKANSIAASGGGPQTVLPERDGRPAHSPMFARPGEPEPNVTRGERLQPPTPRPKRPATRTFAEARALGLAHPEALDLSEAEIAGLFPCG
jgi:hypothetical protein